MAWIPFGFSTFLIFVLHMFSALVKSVLFYVQLDGGNHMPNLLYVGLLAVNSC